MYRKPVFKLAAVILALLVASAAWAGTTGKIAGKVLDRDSGEPLPGVSILIKGTTTGAATNIQGEFFIINVPPGDYDLRVTLVGYGPVEVEKVRVSIDLTTTVDLELSTETIDMGTITVEAVRPLVEKDITSSRILIAGMQITSSAVDGLEDAVSITAGSVLGSFRGGRGGSGEVVYLLDGVNVGNPIGTTRRGAAPGQGNNALATVIPYEAIAEAEVLTGGFGAEYPSVQSAVINVVTRTGGEKYTGKIKSKASPEVIFGRDNMEDDTFHLDWAAPGSTVVVRRAKVDDKNRSDFYDMRQHEFSFGGPVPIEKFDIPGKLSFFTSGIYNYHRNYEDLRGWTKSGSVQGKLTYEISSSKKLTISGLKSTGSRGNWARHHLLTNLTWGEPVYYHRNDVDLATDEVVVVDTFFTPYSWIMAPGHSEGDISQDLMSYWWSQYSDGTWDSSDSAEAVEDYFIANFGGATYHQWAEIPDSIREDAAQYIEGLDYARRYTDWNSENANAKPEFWSSEFSIKFTNNISSKSFYNLSYSRFLTAQRIRVYDPWDGHPLAHEEMREPRIGASPITSIEGSQLWANPMYIHRYRQDDEVTTQSLKGDITTQINSSNLVKFGAEANWYHLFYDYESVASGGNEYTSQYDEEPFQIGVYVQDKIETEGMIVNVGLRWDYFDPKTVVPFDVFDPLNEGYGDPNDERWEQVWDVDARLKNNVPASKKQQLSPRVGISYPITERDVLHVTYGHYFQLPVFDDFYFNHAFDLRGAFKYIGNPNLEEQKTVAYEAGIEHGFNDFIKLSVVGFYKDIADLVSNSKFVNPETGAIFWINENSDYARVKGFEVTLTQRPFKNLSGVMTYSYQVARGKASDPEQSFLDDYNNRKPRTEDFPLDWDQPHTVKANINYRIPPAQGTIMGDWGFDMVYVYGSGRPYTGTASVIPPNLPPINQERLPSEWRLDLRVDKGLNLYKHYNLNAFLEIRNVTDRANITDALDLEKYEITGDPAGQFSDPNVYSSPRRIILGMQFTF